MAGVTDAARSKKISKAHRALGLGSISRASVEGVARFSSHPQSVKPMRILILGGTGFIDPFQVKYALSRGRLIELCSTGPARILSL
jgi:hypothetical protein